MDQVTAALVAMNPSSSIPNLLASLFIPRLPGLLQQLFGAFYSLMKVTKKILQRNYLEKLLKLGLQTTHSQFITKKMIRSFKTNISDEDYDYNFKMVNNQIMKMCLDDAIRDLNRARKIASDQSKECLNVVKSVTRRKIFKTFKNVYCSIVQYQRDCLWY